MYGTQSDSLRVTRGTLIDSLGLVGVIHDTDCFFSPAARFQVVVLSAYKQILAQSTDVLADIDEDNFDRAFGFLRPS